MADIGKLKEEKEKILSIINSIGPSFPVRISQQTGISPLFASAYLSELVKESRLKLSSMKVGSSPLYYIEGQEPRLENFVEYLNQKEKEAFYLLKDSQILSDEEQQPAIRVAIRKLKDFALPIIAKVNGETKLFWRFFLFQEAETKAKIQEVLTKKLFKEIPLRPLEKQEQLKAAKKQKTKIERDYNYQFVNDVKDYLSSKDMEVIEELLQKKKECSLKVRLDTPLGKQEYYLIAKEKKKIGENDLAIALQKSQSEKMPALFISTGDLNKKAHSYLAEWRNFIKFEKLNQKP